jgi:hypothetical protein
MRLTIIPDDKAVYKDGRSILNLDLSGIPANIHALQFNLDSNAGWIEFKDDDFGKKSLNEKITALPNWASICLAKWEEEAARLDAEAAAFLAEQQKTA